jgi:hypothetical protein
MREDLEEIAKLAAVLVDELRSDIELCKTREEHIRMTARANAATNIVYLLDLVTARN